MTTTVDQKASILWRWKESRRERGLLADVDHQMTFNWPSLSSDERTAVMKAYKRREQVAKNTERPSAPSRLAKHTIFCELGHRRYVEAFTDTGTARAFIDLVLHGEKIKWKSQTTITAKEGLLIITSEMLEDIMEAKPSGELPDPITNSVKAFLTGKWPKPGVRASVEGEEGHEENKGPHRRDAAKANKPKPPRELPPGMITLAELCEEKSWDPHKARVLMRKASWKKPAEGWMWKKGAAELTKLAELMRGKRG